MVKRQEPVWNREIEIKETRREWATIDPDDQAKLLALVGILNKANPSKQDSADYLKLINDLNERGLGIESVPYEYFRKPKIKPTQTEAPW